MTYFFSQAQKSKFINLSDRPAILWIVAFAANLLEDRDLV